MAATINRAIDIYLTHIAAQILYKYLHVDAPDGSGTAGHALQPTGTSRNWHSHLPVTLSDWREAAHAWTGQWQKWSAEGYRPKIPSLGDHAFPDVLATVASRNNEQTVQGGGHFLFLGTTDYPPLLAAINDPPLVLAALGDPQAACRPSMSVVGSRKASPWGLRQSAAIGRIASEHGLSVCSGGAFGCDIAVHRGMLQTTITPCRGIVVMASGLSSLYPKAHWLDFRALAERGGVILSERLWWAHSCPADFLVRNRIIAGLSPITVVTEAGDRSGALTTARMALDQGRDVAVLAGNENDVRAKGNQRLIDDGAPAFDGAVCLMESRLLH